jgi:hypothetical protein
MTASWFRLVRPATVMVQQKNHYCLKHLREGSVLHTTAQEPDRNRMIECNCRGDIVLIFSRDLDESAEPFVGKRIEL